MANQEIRDALEVTGWTNSCLALLPNVSTLSGLVNQYGRPVQEFGDEAWGITKSLCDEYCSSEAIPLVSLSYAKDIRNCPLTSERRSNLIVLRLVSPITFCHGSV